MTALLFHCVQSARLWAEREFDGSYTCFDYKGSAIEVYVGKKTEDYNFDREFNDYKQYYSTSLTLVKAEKDA